MGREDARSESGERPGEADRRGHGRQPRRARSCALHHHLWPADSAALHARRSSSPRTGAATTHAMFGRDGVALLVSPTASAMVVKKRTAVGTVMAVNCWLTIPAVRAAARHAATCGCRLLSRQAAAKPAPHSPTTHAMFGRDGVALLVSPTASAM